MPDQTLGQWLYASPGNCLPVQKKETQDSGCMPVQNSEQGDSGQWLYASSG
jgi:hypothetical protein